MKTKKKWCIVTCILLAIIIAIGCICWTENSDSHSETPASFSTTTTSAVTTHTSNTTRTTKITSISATETVTTTSTSHLSSATTSQATKATATKVTTHSKQSSHSETTTHNDVDLSGMEYSNGEYYDKSQLTFTQEDVGKVVGYSPMFNRDIIVVRVDEEQMADGRKGVSIVLGYRGLEGGYWSPSGFCIVECKYCHEFPCPNGGKEECLQYDVKLDGTKTCQRCGLPKGNGYYGTCHGLIDWDNGGTVSCNHYSNCLKCGRPVGDGYNGTCHVTWGIYSGVTTCNHYD